MFQTSRMMEKALKGRAYNDDYMTSSNTSSEGGNAIGDISDLQITRSFMKDSYKVCDWVRAIVDRGAERAAQVEVFPIPLGAKIGIKEGKLSKEVRIHMENVMRLFMLPNSDNESMKDLALKVYRDVLVYDEAGMQILKAERASGSKIPYELICNVSGEELFVNPRKNGTLPNKRTYLQMKNGTQEVASWDKDQLINFIRNKRAGYANGMSPIESCATSVLGDLEGMNFNLKFFENNARPDIAFLFENLGFGKGKSSLDRAKAWYLNNHQGKPHLPLFMGAEKGNVKIQELKYTHRDMQFLDWQGYLLSRIMGVYGMQPIVLGLTSHGEGMSKLDTEIQGDEFKKNMLIPLVNLFTSSLNTSLVWNDSNLNYDDVYITSSNLDIDDEAKQAEIDEKYLDRGVVTINQVRNRLQMPPVPWGALPFVPLNYAPYDTLVKYQQSKIESNVKKAMSDKIDNNVNVSEEDKENVKKALGLSNWNETIHGLVGAYAAINATQDNDPENIAQWLPSMAKNFKMPTGLENVDPTEVKDVVSKMINEREALLTKTYSYSSKFGGKMDVINGFNLDVRKCMKKD